MSNAEVHNLFRQQDAVYFLPTCLIKIYKAAVNRQPRILAIFEFPSLSTFDNRRTWF